MSEILVVTPAPVTQSYTFKDGISIRAVSPILWDQAIVNSVISTREREALEKTPYWLCASKEFEYVADTGDDLYPKVVSAARALQILCPSGSKNVFLKLKQTPKGYDNIGSDHRRKLCNTLIGRITNVEDCGLAQDFDAFYSMVNRAFAEGIVRLQNPILLLEHGMQICNFALGTLMFIMALDMLVMAGEKIPFVERVGGFLRPDSYVFPPDSIMHRQPSVKVQDVLADLYEFRNIVAHGREIPEIPYRQTYSLRDDNGEQINDEGYYYADLMHESSLFLLTEVLHRISVEDLFDDVSDQTKWREKLRLYEHRWKQQQR